MIFWDSSALLTFFMEQLGSDILAPVVAEDPEATIWWGTPVELASGIFGNYRRGSIDSDSLARLLEQVERFAARAEQIDPSENLRRTAMRLLKVHDLRAADALQLAAALAWADSDPTGEKFVCTDKRLREAAQREGFTVLPRGV